MSRLLCLLVISPALAACSDDGGSCGSPGSAGFGLTVSSSDVNIVYGGLTASANNDCPASDAPAGVVSITINGAQMGGTGLLTLCVPRPDQLNATVKLGTDVKLVDMTATDANSCTYTLDSSHVPTGTVEGVGVCKNGEDPAGFGLVFDGFIGLHRACPTATDSVNVGITGNVAVTP